MEEMRWFGLRRHIANDLSVMLWSAQLAEQNLRCASDALAQLKRIQERVHASAARLKAFETNDARLVNGVVKDD